MKKLILPIAIALLANGCTSESPTTGTTKDNVSDISNALVKSACNAISSDDIVSSKTVQAQQISGTAQLTSSTSVGSAGGKTSGAAIKVNTECEGEVSGQTILVSFSARSNDSVSMKVSYSTNDVGNSGWKSFDLNDQFKTYSFEYDVPARSTPGADFIGFLPLTGSAAVKNVSITMG